MHRRLFSHLRGNTIAYIALFFALTGTAAAAKPLITGAQVEDDSITGADVLESSLGTVPSAGLWESWVQVWHSGGTEDFHQIAAGTCQEAAVEADTRPGDIVLGTVHGGSAPNPLPSGLTATFLLDTSGGATTNGQVVLRLCNSTSSSVPAFNVDWQFQVIRDTNPD